MVMDLYLHLLWLQTIFAGQARSTVCYVTAFFAEAEIQPGEVCQAEGQDVSEANCPWLLLWLFRLLAVTQNPATVSV
jgi:hypothetical protein